MNEKKFSYNPMRSTLSNRWTMKKYEGEPIEMAHLFDKLPVNTWYTDLYMSIKYIHFKCETCLQIVGIWNNHKIDDDGIVMPSVGHHCGFHEWVKLEGWK